ncbi:MAG TPA: acyl-CoA dehydrogenase [Polyangiales bacterium]|nr:acyl-CoA dehydrogenase [Polyangiales bacterium]
MVAALVSIAVVCLWIALLYHGRAYLAWLLGAGCALAAVSGLQLTAASGLAAAALLCAALLFGLPPLRRLLVTPMLMRWLSGMLPRLSDTERVALEAGTVWWDGELFSGAPNWRSLFEFEVQELSHSEREFLAGPVEELCGMLDEWEIQQSGDLSPEIWTFLKQRGFFGLIIPREYGGLSFSAAAHSAVVTKLASRSVTAAITVMVPNSLGPAELLLRYGTPEQKQQFLPRLACGQEIPCFALTGPEAGSHAAATQSVGIVCRRSYEGRERLGVCLHWHKRYITLGPVATLIGLAFRLHDPENLLGGVEDIGITIALVPADLPGIARGRRHDPMGVPFQNGPNVGSDVFVPLEAIVGGPQMAGQGWRMLMESLAAGRSISLPALAVGAAELSARIAGAYATVREQFDTPIGRFEGIEEPLARIGGLTYLMNAARVLTAGAVDAGARPAVVSAIVKCYLTEAMRAVVNDAMDIRAGSAICRGPRNDLARAYLAAPIGITVEGANILTRSMIIYGQGALRCHPFLRHEMRAIENADIAAFDRALFGHVNLVFRNAARAFVLGLSDGRLARVGYRGPLRRYVQSLTRLSAALALISDGAMLLLGADLKRREKISGRLADALAFSYLGCASIKFWGDSGRPETALPFARWACEHARQHVHLALDGILQNLPSGWVALLLRVLAFPLGARCAPPSDSLGAQVARALLDDREERNALTADIFVPPPDEPGLGRLEAALDKAVAALAVESAVRDAVREGRIQRAPGHELLDLALRAGVINEFERQRVSDADEARDEVTQVDAFEADAYRSLRR